MELITVKQATENVGGLSNVSKMPDDSQSYLKKHSAFPKNLIVRVSAPMIDGAPPKRFELTSTVHKVGAPIDHECNAHNQENKCQDCRACWDPSIKNVSYKYH